MKQSKQNGAVLFVSIGLLVLCAVVGVGAEDKPAAPDKISPEAAEFFETKVRPLLHDRCFACHNDKVQQGGIRLDTLAGMMKGNSGGPVVIAGNPERSPLIQVIHFDGKIKMPPTGKLKPEEIATLTAWVKMGAPWPGVNRADLEKSLTKAGVISDTAKNHWAFRPVKKILPPKVKNAAWVQNPVDAFILAKLEAKGLKPAPKADRRTLLRRVTYGLTGLPPTAQETAAFLADKSPGAYEKVVDRLLASPRYGEKWARHWLDVARYADTKGYVFTEDSVYHNAYTYRDYVIRAFNEDLPYDQFLIQQLAADRLELGDDRRPLAALGFLTLGRRFLNDGVFIADDRIDTTMRGLMGLTVTCARCHDHKFDPIPTKDYYSLYGVFASMTEPNPPPAISPKAIREPFEKHNQKIVDSERERDNLIQGQVKVLRYKVGRKDITDKDVAATLQAFREEQMPNEPQYKVLSPHFEPDKLKRIQELQALLPELKRTMPPTPEFASGAADTPTPVNPTVFIRGNPNNPGPAVPRQFLAVLSGPDRKPFTQGSGRLELAQAIANRNNPLTARVFVNRVWIQHFGAGLVRTPGDFGIRGEPPTHPELLDWLAARFMDENWSVKKLQRMIVLSAAYQQSSDNPDPRAPLVDPDLRLIWRQHRQRLDFEPLRDSILAASGQLDLTMGGKSVEIIAPPYAKRRAVYGFIERQNLPGLFRTFDFASPDSSSAGRFRTTVPQQALFMMNSPFLVEQARALLRRKEVVDATDETAKIKAVYRAALGRTPTPEEIALGQAYLKTPGAPRELSAWQYGYGGVDETTKRVTNFAPLPHWTGQFWQGSPTMPDGKLGWLLLSPNGGHPGHGSQMAAIRRWKAPTDTVLRITGTLVHANGQGDGVQARVISSRDGELGRWTAHNGQAATEIKRVVVKKGDTLDFVTDCRNEESFDSFNWSPVLSVLPPRGVRPAVAGALPVWSAEADFHGPETKNATDSVWEKYAHALLMTNEFCFVD